MYSEITRIKHCKFTKIIPPHQIYFPHINLIPQNSNTLLTLNSLKPFPLRHPPDKKHSSKPQLLITNYQLLITKGSTSYQTNPKINSKKHQKNLHTSKKLPNFAAQNQAGAIAQLVEQRTENPCVPGSIPGGTTKIPRQPSGYCRKYQIICNLLTPAVSQF